MKRRYLHICLTLILLAVLGSGCSPESSAGMSEASEQESLEREHAGTVFAEYRPGGDWQTGQVDQPGQIHVNAQFFEIEGARPTEAMEALDVWQPKWDLARDSCSLLDNISSTSARPSASGDVRMDFLDVGDITLTGPQQTTNLRPRQLPFVTTDLSGVIYGKNIAPEKSVARGLVPGRRYRISAPGSERISGFSVGLRVPSRPNLKVETASGLWAEKRFIPVSEDELKIEWSGSTSDKESVFVDFKSEQHVLKCRLVDDGTFRVPVQVLEQMIEKTGEQIYLRLRRVRTKSVDIDGLGESEFIFSTTEKVALSIRS